MALLILSQQLVSTAETLNSVKRVALNLGADMQVEDKINSVEIYFGMKKYIADIEETIDNFNIQYFYLYLESQALRPTIHLFKDESVKDYYRLAGTDNVWYEHIMYDFSLEYLKLNPTHLIGFIPYETNYFTLKDMMNFEAKGGYFENWTEIYH